MNEVKLSLELVNAILSYFGRQPFDDVAYLVGHIRSQVDPQVTSQHALDNTSETV